MSSPQLVFLLWKYSDDTTNTQLRQEILTLNPSLDLSPTSLDTTIQAAEAELGWDKPLTIKKLIPLYTVLEEQYWVRDHAFIAQTLEQLRFPPETVQRLAQDQDLCLQTLTTTRLLLKRWKEELDLVDQRPSHDNPIDPAFFNKESFMHRMALDQLNLQDLALLAIPGGIYYLEELLELPLTNKKKAFFRNYNLKYYTRNCDSYMTQEQAANKAARYGDFDVVKEKYAQNSSLLYSILEGAALGGHLEFIKLYLPKYFEYETDEYESQSVVRWVMRKALAAGHRNIYYYLAADYSSPIREIIEDATGRGDLEIFKEFMALYPHIADLAPDLCYFAAHKNRQNILDELENRGLLDPESVLEGAISGGCVGGVMTFIREIPEVYSEPLEHYIPHLDCSVHQNFTEYLHYRSGSSQLNQVLYDAGYVPRSASVFENLASPAGDIKLDVDKFILDHTDIAVLSCPDGSAPDLQTNLRFVLTQVFHSHNPKLIALVIDHPNIARYQPWPVLWDVITSPLGGSALTLSQFAPVVAQMLLDRGFVFDARIELDTKTTLTPQMKSFLRRFL